MLLHPPRQPPQPPQPQQQQSFRSTSPIGTTVSVAPFLLVQGFPNHHHNTAPQLPPIAHFSASGFGNPAACIMNRPPPTAMLFRCGGLPGPLSLNTRDTAYAHYHHYDAYADHSDASSVYGAMEHGQDLAFGDRLY